ncbi:hypothetical protein GXW82_17885 [Streptacidiphilus sp. 4-A2]|nr:hypothetical protein [Streptacidiphilus sp. 4-A2]
MVIDVPQIVDVIANPRGVPSWSAMSGMSAPGSSPVAWPSSGSGSWRIRWPWTPVRLTAGGGHGVAGAEGAAGSGAGAEGRPKPAASRRSRSAPVTCWSGQGCHCPVPVGAGEEAVVSGAAEDTAVGLSGVLAVAEDPAVVDPVADAVGLSAPDSGGALAGAAAGTAPWPVGGVIPVPTRPLGRSAPAGSRPGSRLRKVFPPWRSSG